MKEIYKNALDKATLPKESKENLKSLYDKVNQEDNVMSIEKKRNVKKPLAFVAAGLVCAVAVGSTFAVGHFNDSKNSSSKNNFVLNVSAAEIGRKAANSDKTDTKGSKVTLGTSGYLVSQDDDKTWHYDFTLPVVCKGNNIDEITYTVNRGSITLNAGSTLDSEKTDTDKDATEIADKTSDSTLDSEKTDTDKAATEIADKKSETVSYKALPKDKLVSLDIYGDSTSLSKLEQQILDKGLIPQADMEQYKKAIDTLLKDLKVTVKAKFNDGTTEEETINVNSKLCTSEELSDDEQRDDDIMLYNDDLDSDEDDVYLSFEVEK